LRYILKHITLLVFIFCGLTKAFAQQLPLYTQYKNNAFLLNPAMAGYDGYTSFNLTSRRQWIGIENSPVTYSLSAQTRLLKRSHRIVNKPVRSNVLIPSTQGRVGLGGYLFNDQNGHVSRTGMQFTYAYHIIMHRQQLSFGLGGQIFQYKIDESRLFYMDPGDPLDPSSLNAVALIPDANVGVLLSSDDYFIGFSANQLFESVLKLGSTDLSSLKLHRHYYLLGGRTFNLNQNFDIEPTFLFKTTEQFFPQIDLSCKISYGNDYWAGLSYRSSGSVSGLFGVRANNLFIGYAYDFALTSIRKHSIGSHEVFLSLKLGDNARRYRWINRY
jgi:type IX secretion system PorP/SprF family membrane protein